MSFEFHPGRARTPLCAGSTVARLKAGFGAQRSARPTFRQLALLAGAAALAAPRTALACAACYGASDAPMAQGMNWGILSLLGIIGTVLAGVAGFFVYLAVRASKVTSAPMPAPDAGLAESTATL